MITPSFARIEEALAKVRGTRLAGVEGEILRPEARELFSALMDEVIMVGADDLDGIDMIILTTIAACAAWQLDDHLETARKIQKDISRLKSDPARVLGSWQRVLDRGGLQISSDGTRLVHAEANHGTVELTREQLAKLLTAGLWQVASAAKLGLVPTRLAVEKDLPP